ncbi:MAG: energy transducer TonB, partial [Burkholderiales bacterium]|nr:energy transducer TonB [Burkholderiales bacterium]
MNSAISFRQPVLPWSVAAADERRFQRILRATLGVALALALVLPWLPRPKIERLQAQPLPPPMARLLLDRPAPPQAAKPPEPARPEAVAPTARPQAPAPVA